MQEGVTRGVTAKTNEPIKIKDIRKMVDKALTTPVMVQTGFGSVVEYQVFDGENGVAFSTLETRCLNPSSFYVTYKSNNIILTGKDLKSTTAVASNTDDLYSLEFTLTEEGKEKLAKATEEILKAPEGETYVKVIFGEIIAKPKVVAKIDSEKFVVQGQFNKSKAEAIVKAISNYENE